MAFSTKIKGNHHLQGNVQVYNVRIPVCTTRNQGLVLLFKGAKINTWVMEGSWLRLQMVESAQLSETGS